MRHLTWLRLRVTWCQVARKWGDDAKEPAALDFSEKVEGVSGDSEPDQAPGEGAPPPDLSLKSRIDEDEDAEESEEEGELPTVNAMHKADQSMPLHPCLTWSPCANLQRRRRRRRRRRVAALPNQAAVAAC